MRRELDFYPTAAWATEALLERVPIAGRVLEPCCGAGDIVTVLNASDRIREVHVNDIDKQWVREPADATNARYWRSRQWDTATPDWVVTNPPFGVAHKIVPLAWETARVGVAMLLRLTYLEPCEGRAGWLARHPPDKLIVLPRISFTGEGKTDLATCAWFVWCHNEPVWKQNELCPAIEVVPPPSLAPGRMFDEVTDAP